MSLGNQSQQLPAGGYRRLINMFEEYSECMSVALDAESWTHQDFPAPEARCKAVTNKLQAAGAVRSIGTETHVTGDEQYEVNEWTWVDGVRSKLVEYNDSKAKLPCGHRAHVHHRDGGYGCQYCDVERDYDRDLVAEVMPA